MDIPFTEGETVWLSGADGSLLAKIECAPGESPPEAIARWNASRPAPTLEERRRTIAQVEANIAETREGRLLSPAGIAEAERVLCAMRQALAEAEAAAEG